VHGKSKFKPGFIKVKMANRNW